MENVVYILGAGFSAPLGLPVMSNFLMKAKEMFADNPDRYAHFKAVFDTIAEMHIAKSYYRTDLLNIEEILSILEMDGYLHKSVKKREYTKFLATVVDNCTCPIAPYLHTFPNDWYRFVLGSEPLWNWYGCFVGNIVNLILRRQNGSLSALSIPEPVTKYQVVTVNYDMVLENARQYIKTLTREVQVIDHPMSELQISKLHGSSNDPKTIVPPTWNKMTSNLLIENWRFAWKWLSAANHIRIIGYSLPATDTYVKYLLKSAILKSFNLKTIDVICRDESGEVKKRFDEFITFDFYRFCRVQVQDYLQGNFDYHVNWFHQNVRGEHYEQVVYNYLEEVHDQFMEARKI